MWSQIVSSTINSLPSILGAQGGASGFPTFNTNGVDKAKLATLRFILLGQRPDDEPVVRYMETFKETSANPDNGPWAYTIPEDLVKLLAMMSPAEIPNISEAWAATEEARLDRWSANDLVAPLSELSAFASGTLARAEAMFLIISLQ